MIFTIFILFFAFAEPVFARSHQWSWTDNDRTYSLAVNEKKASFLSHQTQIDIPVNNCTKPFITELSSQMTEILENYKNKRKLPKNSYPIQFIAGQVGSFEVARGTDLGFFLIDAKSSFNLIASKARAFCVK